jgi:hypothetical protein
VAAARPLTVLLAAVAACPLVAGCEPDTAERGPPRPAPPAEALTLEGAGLGCLAIGAPLAALTGECRILTDRMLPGPEGEPERRAEILVGGDTVVATVVGDSVWRVEVTTPRFVTSDGVGVGSPVDRLLVRPGSRVIGGEARLFITLADRCGISFEVGGIGADVRALPPEEAVERIGGARVSRILLFGCGDPA